MHAILSVFSLYIWQIIKANNYSVMVRGIRCTYKGVIPGCSTKVLSLTKQWGIQKGKHQTEVTVCSLIKGGKRKREGCQLDDTLIKCDWGGQCEGGEQKEYCLLSCVRERDVPLSIIYIERKKNKTYGEDRLENKVSFDWTDLFLLGEKNSNGKWRRGALTWKAVRWSDLAGSYPVLHALG